MLTLCCDGMGAAAPTVCAMAVSAAVRCAVAASMVVSAAANVLVLVARRAWVPQPPAARLVCVEVSPPARQAV